MKQLYTGKIILTGSIILRDERINGEILSRCLPNFLVIHAPNEIIFNHDNLQDDVKTLGNHPFESIRKRLFNTKPLISYDSAEIDLKTFFDSCPNKKFFLK